MSSEVPIRAWRRAQAAASLDAVPGDAPSVPVARVMSRPPITVPADAPLRRARDMMRELRLHHLLLEDRGRIVGIVSDRDVYRALSPYAGGPYSSRRDDATLDQPLYRLGSFRLLTVRHDAPIEEAAARLLDHDISALPVVDDRGGIIGMVTTHDLMRGLLACALPEHEPPR